MCPPKNMCALPKVEVDNADWAVFADLAHFQDMIEIFLIRREQIEEVLLYCSILKQIEEERISTNSECKTR